MIKRIRFAILIALLMTAVVHSANTGINLSLLSNRWEAQWIAPPGENGTAYGVYHYRHTFLLENKPDRFIIHVSADNRYRLFVNGKIVSSGPARGDLAHWNFESIDIAPYLNSGKNVLAATVWNFAEYRPWAQITARTALIVQGDSKAELLVNSDKSWKVIRDEAYSPLIKPDFDRDEIVIIGARVKIDGQLYPWGWQNPDYDDSHWADALPVGFGEPAGVAGDSPWKLVPRAIPPMETDTIYFHAIRRSEGANIPDGFLPGNADLEIPAHRDATLLLDQQELTTATPNIVVSGGKGSQITLIYAEALKDSLGHKLDRKRVKGLKLYGYHDVFVPDGGLHRKFHPLWFRTYRFVELKVKTANAPLTIHRVAGEFSAYPFRAKASFVCEDAGLDSIWQTGWRTVRLCSHETYFDSPYYEQMQYLADARIEALISVYVSGDARLMRNTLLQFRNAQLPSGLMPARYPDYRRTIIPSFSLFWIAMLHDYWQFRDDRPFISEMLPAADAVLKFYQQYINKSNMLDPLPFWNFVDWTADWQHESGSPFSETVKNYWLRFKAKFTDIKIRQGGEPPGDLEGNSAILTLQYVQALRQAAELHSALGDDKQAAQYAATADAVSHSVLALCWDEERQLLADTPDKAHFSVHANVNGVLAGLFPPAKARRVLANALADTNITQPSLYYHFYVFEALKKAGMGDRFADLLYPWKRALQLGYSTFPETGETSPRSDCHGWSASPVYEFLSLICGIMPEEAGFRKVRIEPAPGSLQRVDGSMPIPAGKITVHFRKTAKNGLQGSIDLPAGVSGHLIWKGHDIPLHAGFQSIKAD